MDLRRTQVSRRTWLLAIWTISLLAPDLPVTIASQNQNSQNEVLTSTATSGWTRWSTWSECSRSCDVGVMSRTRTCKDKKSDGKVGGSTRAASSCVGLYREFKTCNTHQRCPMRSPEFRVVQCQRYNNQTFSGKSYSWEPFYKGPNPCSLSCRPRGMRFFMQLSSQVVDGTRCQPDDPYHICISGQCELVGCDGVLGSEKKLDRCGVCGGNDLTCHIISGIFTRTQLPNGYNKVTTIPRGACNVNVTELVPSINRLAVKLTEGRYIVNGNWELVPSNEFEGAGTVFRYFHPSATEVLELMKEYVLAPGPLNSSIDIMVIQEHQNRGIIYSYTIPSQQGSTKSHIRHHRHKHTPKPAARPPRPSTNDTTSPPSSPSSATPSTIVEADDDDDKRASQIQADQYQSDQVVIPNAYQELLQRQQLLGSSYPKSYQPGAASYPGQPGAASYPGQAGAASYPGQAGAASYPGQAGAASYPGQPRTFNSAYVGSVLQQSGKNIYRGPGKPGEDTARNGSPDKSSLSDDPGNTKPHRRLQAQPGINYGIQGPVVPGADNRYPNPNGYGQPQYPVLPPGGQGVPPYQPSAWYPGQQQGYQPVGNNPYQAYQYPGSYQPRPYQIPPPISQQQYYPNPGNAALEQPSGNGYAGQDFYRPQAIQPVPRQNNQVPLQNMQDAGSLNGGGAGYNGGGAGYNGNGAGYNGGGTDYSWKLTGFSECSRTCGGGVQHTLVVCMKVTGVQVAVTDENCDASLKPTTRSVTCNNSPCPPSWEASNWTECSTSCDRGQQTRGVECKQRVSTTLSVGVSASRCLHEPRPESVRACNDDRPCVRWRIGNWSQCSADCGRGQRTREVVCMNVENKTIAENKCGGSKPRTVEICDMGSCVKTWFHTEWSEQCSIGCGEGVQTRSIHCSAEVQRCNEINRPKSEKPCRNEVPCGGNWFTGPWNHCSVSCGEGVVRRDVVCMKKLGQSLVVVGEENCPEEDRPETEEPCDEEPCQPEWFMTDWTECSRSCDTGLRTREVKCLTAEQQTSQLCDPATRPEVRQVCNTNPCLPHAGRNNTHSPAAYCQDKFKNCRVVVQARLCRYAYYKDACCFSCISHGYDDVTT